MEYLEMHTAITSLVDAFARTDPGQDWGSVVHLLDYGQDDEAMDVLIATLVRFDVPVTSEQRESLRHLMIELEPPEHVRQNYRYLGDPEMLDRMTVVDESA